MYIIVYKFKYDSSIKKSGINFHENRTYHSTKLQGIKKTTMSAKKNCEYI